MLIRASARRELFYPLYRARGLFLPIHAPIVYRGFFHGRAGSKISLVMLS